MKHKSDNQSTDFRICVVLTAFNDEEAIYDAVKDFISQDNVEKVIVIDNNCQDNTSVQAKKAGAIVIRECNQGYGFSIIRGLNEALKDKTEVIVLAEGDRTFRGRDIRKMLPYLEDVDMVVGTRMHKVLVEPDSQLDWFYVWGNTLLAKVLELKFFTFGFYSKVRFTDVGCTYRAIKTKALRKIIDKLVVGGHHFSPHMTLVAIKSGLRVVEVPVTFGKRVGISKGAGGNRVLAFKVGLKMLWDILTK